VVPIREYSALFLQRALGYITHILYVAKSILKDMNNARTVTI
jgi:hypothetical protein